MKKIFLLTTLLYAACWQAEAQYVSKAWVSDQKMAHTSIRCCMPIIPIRMSARQVKISI